MQRLSAESGANTEHAAEKRGEAAMTEKNGEAALTEKNGEAALKEKDGRVILKKKNSADVIIPVYRPDALFLKELCMLAKQSVPIGRLILMNTEEALWTKEADELVRRLSKESNAIGSILLCHITKEAFDHAATRREAVCRSDAPVFVCMTDDAVPADERLLERLISGLLAEEKRGMAYARQLPTEICGEAERFTRAFNYPAQSLEKSADDLPRLGIKTYFASNVCCAYRRDVYDRLGGFCADAIFNEDMLYAAKLIGAGGRIFYCADAAVYHAHRYTAMQQLRRNFDLGVSQAMHPEVFSGIRSEGEGLRLVRETAAHLFKTGHPLLIPELFWQSGFKYAGYRLGKAYRRLPYGLSLRLSMNREYIKRHRTVFGAGSEKKEK